MHAAGQCAARLTLCPIIYHADCASCTLTEQADAVVVHGAGLRGVLNLPRVAPPCVLADVLEGALLPVVRLPSVALDDLQSTKIE